MTNSKFAFTIRVQIELLKTSEGGLSCAVGLIYRPLCVFPTDSREVVGMCQLELASPLAPGATAAALLGFDALVAERARELIARYPEFALEEGSQVIGSARVIDGSLYPHAN